MKRPPLVPLGEQLRAAREATDMTAAAAARALGYKGADTSVASVVLAYEAGRRTPSEETLLKLAALYGRRLEYLKVETPAGRVVVVAEPAGR